MIAVFVGMNPEASPCETCTCVDGDAGFYRWKILGERLFTAENGEAIDSSRICPRKMVTQDSAHLLTLYNHYKAGHLLRAGGIAKQPSLYLESMRVIDVAVTQAKDNAIKS